MNLESELEAAEADASTALLDFKGIAQCP